MASVPSNSPLYAAQKDVYSKVELSIACKSLKDMDFFSKSDPVEFAYEQTGLNWEKVGRTEVIDNNLNPKVCTMVVLVATYEYVHLNITLNHLSNTVFKDIHYELSF